MVIIPESLPHLRFEITEAARILCISRATLYERVLRHAKNRVFVGGSHKQLIRRRKPRAIDVGMRPLTLGGDLRSGFIALPSPLISHCKITRRVARRFPYRFRMKWRPHGDSNPGRIRERDVS
jgi:hypothetical protein